MPTDAEIFDQYASSLGPPTGGYNAPTNTAGTHRTGGLARANTTSREAFIASTLPIARYWEQQTGIPAELFQAITASESNWGQAPGNELFGIKGPGQKLATHEVVNGQVVPVNDSFRAYPSVDAAYKDFVGLISQGRYAPAWQQFQQDHDAASLLRGVNKAGYATDPAWADKMLDTAQTTVRPMQAASRSRGNADLVPYQFDAATLTPTEAAGACGPAAAVAFARAQGREPTLREAMDLAKQTGWTDSGGMNGLANEYKLMQSMGIKAKMVQAPEWSAVQHDAMTGNPVTISTQNHYFVIDAYDPATGKYHVGNSGRAAKGGSTWMDPDEMTKTEGEINGALFSDYAGSPHASIAAGGTPNASDQTHPYYGPNYASATDGSIQDLTDDSTGYDAQQQQADDQEANDMMTDATRPHGSDPTGGYGYTQRAEPETPQVDYSVPEFSAPQDRPSSPLQAPQMASLSMPELDPMALQSRKHAAFQLPALN